MSVSHYLVSEIQVIGLMVGLIGLFYLSRNLFDNNGLHWVRPMLPATSAGLAVLLSAAAAANNGQHAAISGVVWVIAGATFALFYTSTFKLTREGIKRVHEQSRLGRWSIRFSTWGGLAMLGLMSLVFAAQLGITLGVYAVSPPGKSPWSHGQTPPPVFMLGVWASAVLLWLTNQSGVIISDDQLTRLGFVLSVAGVMTQFIPPVLDVLNISIK